MNFTKCDAIGNRDASYVTNNTKKEVSNHATSTDAAKNNFGAKHLRTLLSEVATSSVLEKKLFLKTSEYLQENTKHLC